MTPGFQNPRNVDLKETKMVSPDPDFAGEKKGYGGLRGELL